LFIGKNGRDSISAKLFDAPLTENGKRDVKLITNKISYIEDLSQFSGPQSLMMQNLFFT
jgi:hypothetical protein